MSNFKERMGILPKHYNYPQMTELDRDTRIDLLNEVYSHLLDFDSVESVEKLALEFWRLVARKPTRELLDIVENYEGLETGDWIDSFYREEVEIYFTDKNSSIWDVLQTCETVLKYSSLILRSKYFPNSKELKPVDAGEVSKKNIRNI